MQRETETPKGIDTPQRCKLCKGTFTVREIVHAGSSYWPEVDVMISEAPCCHKAEELRIGYGRIWRGYTYAAGAAHFCAMEEYKAPTLDLKQKDSSALWFTLDGVEIQLKSAS